SLTESMRALAIDPNDPRMKAHLGWHYLFAGQTELAIAQCKKTIEDGDNYWARLYLGEAYEQVGRYDLAIDELKEAVKKSPGSTEAIAALGHAYAVSGERGQALSIINEVNEAAKSAYVSLGLESLIYAGLKDKETALSLLERAASEHTGWVVYLNVDPRLNVLHSEERFKALVKRIGISK